MGFVCFMARPAGRIARVVAGIGLILVGLLAVGGVTGILLAALGAVMFLAGAVNVCIFAPLFRAPFMGRSAIERPH
ncbi:MAG: YgaP family membrane protein [Candidatus Dormibacteria bacterium]